MLKLENVGKIYSTEGNLAIGIRRVNLTLQKGEFVAITGESGSGKSTLLNILSGIDNYEEGEMYINGEETSYYSMEDLEEYRNKYVGFIFQSYNIIDSYTVYENIESSLIFAGYDPEKRRERALELIEKVGLTKRINAKASKLSGGEKQRVVIARALAKDPAIIAADEPTGNLDSKSSKEIIELLHEVSEDKLVLIVTHDFEEVKDYATRMIRVFDGEIKEDIDLKPVEKSNLPNLFDEEKKSLPFKDLFKLSLKDLFSSPKRFIFNFIVLFFMGVAAVGAIIIFHAGQKEIGGTYSSNSFANADSSRVILNKSNGEPFSESDINALKDNRLVKYVETHDLLFDFSFFLYFENTNTYDNVYLSLYGNRASVLSERDLAAGRLPENNDEIVATVYEYDFYGEYDSFDSFLEKAEMYTFSDEFKPTVVGIVNGETYDSESGYVYFYDDFYDSLYFDNLLRDYSSFIFRNDSGTDTFGGYIRPLASLSDSEFYLTYFSLSEKENINITASDIYRELFSFNGMSYKDCSNEFDIRRSGIVYLSENNYNSIFSKVKNENYQATIMLKNGNNADSFRRSMERQGYNVVVPSLDGNEESMISPLLLGVLLFGIASYLVETFFIVYVILLHSFVSRRDDFEILRTIGATKSNVKNMLSIEFGFISIVSYIILIITYIILRSVAYGDFLVYLKTAKVIEFVVLFFVIFLMNFLLSRMFSLIVFRKTVRKSLQTK